MKKSKKQKTEEPKNRRTEEPKNPRPLGWIDPANPPAAGTVYVFPGEGDILPHKQVIEAVAGGRVTYTHVDDEITEEGITTGVESWNAADARRCTRVEPPLPMRAPTAAGGDGGAGPTVRINGLPPEDPAAGIPASSEQQQAAFRLIDALIDAAASCAGQDAAARREAERRAGQALAACTDRTACQVAQQRAVCDGWGSTTLQMPAASETGLPVTVNDLIRQRVQDLAPPPVFDAPVQSIDLAAVVEVQNERIGLNEQALAELAESLRTLGQLQPIGVRAVAAGPAEAAAGGRPVRYEIMYGHRRVAAARRLEWTRISAAVFPADIRQDQVAARRLAENLARADLSHMEIARIIGRARAEGMTSREIHRQTGMSMDAVQKHHLLNRLCEPVAQLVHDGRLPVKLAEKIAAVGRADVQQDLAGGCLNLDYDKKAAAWKVAPLGFNADPVTWARYVKPLGELMADIAWRMKGIAGGGWPVDCEYAGRRPCTGCPACSVTYQGEDAEFWSGCKPQASGSKGYCTDESCYNAKLKLAEKQKAERKAAAEQATADKIARAQDLGFAVCEQCGKDAIDAKALKAVGKRKLCEKCAKKAERSSAGGGGGDWQARQMAVDALRKAFPSNHAQRFALALHEHGLAVCTAITERLAKAAPKDAVATILGLMVRYRCGCYLSHEAQKKHGGWRIGQEVPGATLADLLNAELRRSIAESYEPGIRYDGKDECIPPPAAKLAALADLEALAAHWKVSIPARPVEADYSDEAIAAAKAAARLDKKTAKPTAAGGGPKKAAGPKSGKAGGR